MYYWLETVCTLLPQLFDIPSEGGSPFEDRMEVLNSLFGPSGSHACSEVKVLEQIKAQDKDHVLSFLKDIESRGGEGIMLREPESKYEGRRSATLLKLKVCFHFYTFGMQIRMNMIF